MGRRSALRRSERGHRPDAAPLDSHNGGAPHRAPRRYLLAGALTGVALVAAVVVVVTSSGGGGANASLASISTATATITRQDLVQVDSETGTLGYDDSRQVINHLSGTVTWLPAQGSVITPGHTLYRVDGSPVLLLAGSTPAYRTLEAGVSGTDVLELQRNLRALGFDPNHDITINGNWSDATTAAVDRFQQAHGLSQTGSLELGRVVFLPGARRVASTAVALGAQSGGGAAGGAPAGGAAGAASGAVTQTAAYHTSGSSTPHLEYAVYTTTAPAPRATLASATTQTTATPAPAAPPAPTAAAPTTGAPGVTGTTTPSTTTPTTTVPTTTAPSGTPTTPKAPTGKTHAKHTGHRPAGSGSVRASGSKGAPPSAGFSAAPSGFTGGAAPSGGSGGGASAVPAQPPANAIMTTTSTHRVVTVNLDTTKSSVAQLGASVTVQLPSSKYVHGWIVSIGKVATSSAGATGGTPSSSSPSSGSSTAGATIPITIRLTATGTALDQAPVTVRFQQSRVRNVLAIPVTALLARPGGTFAVQVVNGHSKQIVAVTPGLYTDGYVQIEGSGLQPGMTITNAAF